MPIFGRKNNDKNNDQVPDNIPGENAQEETPAEEPEKEAITAASETDIPVTAEAPEEAPAPENPQANVPAAQNAGKPRYQTPEGFDFNRYFLAERRISLENVSYETQRPAVTQGQLRLNAKDTIVAQLIGQAGVKATYNRTMSFEPEGPFTVSVSFSVMLVFNPGTRGEIDWRTIDIAEEFKKNCPQLVQTMMTKAALLIAEITNANGTPILPLAMR